MSTKKKADREVPVGAFVSKGKAVVGTPSNTERSRTGAYAASSVIERGTAASLAASSGTDDQKHTCACGCGQQPSQLGSLFMPGHDSKVRAMGKAVLEGRVKETALPAIARKYLHDGGML